MNKGFFLTITLVLLLFFSACVAEEKPVEKANGAPSVVDVLNRSESAAQKVETYSFNMQGYMCFTGLGSDVCLERFSSNFSWNGAVDRKNQLIHDIWAGYYTSTNYSIEAYTSDGVNYANMPGLGWVKNPTPEGFWNRDPIFLLVNLSNATSTLLPDESINGVNYYVVSFKLNPLDEAGLPGHLFFDSPYQVRDADIKEWIAKDTFLVKKRVMMLRLVKRQGAVSYINATLDLYDYDKPLNIELTEDAKAANHQ